MAALPAEQYADPCEVVEREQTGDVMPASKPQQPRSCLTCCHARSSVGQWPCRLGNMPSSSTGRCRGWVG